MSQFFRIDIEPTGIIHLTLDVQGESVNTLQEALIPEFAALLSRWQEDTSIMGLIIDSAKEGNFIAGADIRMLDACTSSDMAQRLAQQGQDLFTRLAALPFPVVAAIDGTCLGGGLELALACDYRVASDSPKTRLGLPEIQLGLIPGSGGTQRLPRLIGLPKALDLMLTGRQLDARAAQRIGLIDERVAAPLLVQAATRLVGEGKRRGRLPWLQHLVCHVAPLRGWVFKKAREQAQTQTRGNYPAPARLLATVETGLAQGVPAGLECEALHFGHLVMTSESQALRALFHASTAHKKEKLYQGAAAWPIRRVGVLGAGLMGAGIAHVTASRAQLPVRIKDTRFDAVNRAISHTRQELQRQLQKRRITESDLREQLARLSGCVDYQGFQRLDVVVEAVFEDLDLKRQMVAEVLAAGHPQTIFASNTSSLPITQIAEGATDPSRIVGLHYFSPVEKMPLVEIIPHAGTAPEVVATVLALARAQGKTPIVVQDRAGFYVNRILAPYMNEAVSLLFEGETITDIDHTLRDAGFPVGPLTLLDEVGLDVAAKIGPILVAAHGARFTPNGALQTMLDDGRKGRKTQQGFYRYPVRGKKIVDTRLYDLLKVLPVKRLEPQLMVDRCLLLMLNEAVRCLDEAVIASPRDGDLAAVYGIGYPPFQGGPFRHMERLGLANVAARLQELALHYGDRFEPCAGLLRRAEAGESFYPL
jgi:3-hydroxyacyl-CoA dehydrogenase / enoyl-CoA hydratase / 3-hydroxybutyryl-CoA epimerase